MMKWLDKLNSKHLTPPGSEFLRVAVFLTRFWYRPSLVVRLSLCCLWRAQVRASSAEGMYPGVARQASGVKGDPGDPSQCDYWRYCAIDGFLCSLLRRHTKFLSTWY